MINIWIYEKPQSKFLAFLVDEKSQDVLITVEQFVDGFFQGVSSVPIEQNECSKDISAVKHEIVNVVSQLIDAIKTHNVHKILDAITKVIDIDLKFKDSYTNCNFGTLANKLATLSTKTGIADLGFAVVCHLPVTITGIKQIDSGINGNNYVSIGRTVGDLFKVL